MINNEWNRGKQYDLSRVDDQTLLYYMGEALIKADVANEIAKLILREATERGIV